MMLAEVVAPDLQDSGENHRGFQTLLPAMLKTHYQASDENNLRQSRKMKVSGDAAAQPSAEQ
jgi:hypothetical protein